MRGVHGVATSRGCCCFQGKGLMQTYWLLNEDENHRKQRLLNVPDCDNNTLHAHLQPPRSTNTQRRWVTIPSSSASVCRHFVKLLLLLTRVRSTKRHRFTRRNMAAPLNSSVEDSFANLFQACDVTIKYGRHSQHETQQRRHGYRERSKLMNRAPALNINFDETGHSLHDVMKRNFSGNDVTRDTVERSNASNV